MRLVQLLCVGGERRVAVVEADQLRVLEGPRTVFALANAALDSGTSNPDFSDVAGNVAIERGRQVLWSRDIRTGEAAMCHSLENLEHHHFKSENHRRPGDLHVHYFGADAFSFGAGIRLQARDVMRVEFHGENSAPSFQPAFQSSPLSFT